jgi:polysaccharide chain length determinant protein (PEP-CTERM system associated)
MPDILFLAQLLLRRLHYIILIATPVAVLGVLVALKLPPIYSAQARLLVESPQLPTDLAASTLRVGTAEILRVLEQRLLTRGNVLALSREFSLHDNTMTADAIISDMRRRINIRLPGGRDPAQFVTISFDAANPEVSAEVVGRLVTRLTSDFAELRTEATRQTSDFFESEVERLNAALGEQTARLLAFQENNMDALPETLAFRRSRQTALQERLVQMDRDIDQLQDRRKRMVRLFESSGQLNATTAPQSPREAELRRLRLQLLEARAVFSSTNPRLQTLERRIAILESEGEGESEEGQSETETGPTTQFELELADLDGQIAFLEQRKAAMEAELQELNRSIEETPALAVELGALERELDTTRGEYNQALSRQMEARIGERVETRSQGRRLTVIEPPVPPNAPTKPNRPMIAAAGGVFGMAIGVGIVGLFELLNTTVRRPVDITNTMGGVAPFASLPMLRTRRQILLRRITIATVILLAVIGAAVGAWLVEQYVMPIDVLVERIANRIGLTPLWTTFVGAMR